MRELTDHDALRWTWQPIETAPTDGTRILLRGKDGKIADGHYGQPDGYANPKQFVWPYINANPTHWRPLPAQHESAAPVELPEPEAIERIATTRYRCVPIRLFGYKVVSGDGDRSLFEGTKDECYVVARKLTEAFLDGAHVAFRQMHQYGDAREAAGYARGVAEERERCAAICDRMGNPLNVKYEGGGCRKAAAAIRAAQKGDE